ncbi:hypothetical protein RDWZM_002910 [Blomia tropicalis]|uniref:Uncharacterized protein n=1 Tax=Blomia tropicalis TaxID=40697 RepID=A0A9Q0RS68_BLOTA|nr:hypothetical protein RDWZM_002910 [Blomia tropicalis]
MSMMTMMMEKEYKKKNLDDDGEEEEEDEEASPENNPKQTMRPRYTGAICLIVYGYLIIHNACIHLIFFPIIIIVIVRRLNVGSVNEHLPKQDN